MVTIFREYLDVIGSIIHSTNDWLELIKVTVFFFGQSFSSCFIYFVTFGWFRDLLYLPILLPKWQELIYYEHFFYENLNVQYFQDVYHETPLFFLMIGFLNSFFCSLPVSTTHLLVMRRGMIQGKAAGIASTAGMVFGQCLFLFFTVFGIRWALIPWFSWDGIPFLCGFYLLLSTVFTMAHEKGVREVRSTPLLVRYGFSTFLLTFTEQANIYQYLSHLNLTNQPSLLTGGTGGHFSYWLGLLLGHIFFSTFFLFIGVRFKDQLYKILDLPYTVYLKRLNTSLLILIISFSFSVIPYYGLDYLLTNPLGFRSSEVVLNSSVLPQRNIEDPAVLFTSLDTDYPFTIDTDISYYDRGDYGDSVSFFNHSVEELNYQAEYAWFNRQDRQANFSTTRSSFLGLLNPKTKEPDSPDSSPTEPRQRSVPKRVKQNSGIIPTPQKARQYSSLNVHQPNIEGSRSVYYPLAGKEDGTILGFRILGFENYRKKHRFHPGDTFDRPFLPSELTPIALVKSLKDKFYRNPVYQQLLNFEIDAYLSREPSEYQLTRSDDIYLSKCRYWLSKYYDTLRAYQLVPYHSYFNQLLCGSKSFVDRAYHHKFQGSMPNIRRLLAVNTKARKKVSFLGTRFRFDQTLFDPPKGSFLAHEEIPFKKGDSLFSSMTHVANSYPIVEPIAFPTSSSALTTSWNDFLRDFQNGQGFSGFLEVNDSTPFYLGWDHATAQMIFTKRFISQNQKVLLESTDPAGGHLPSKWQTLFQRSDMVKTRLTFSTWPLPKDVLYYFKSQASNPVVTLFELDSNPEIRSTVKESRKKRKRLRVLKFPTNLRYFSKIPENMDPNQNIQTGFLWPGTQYSYMYSSKQT